MEINQIFKKKRSCLLYIIPVVIGLLCLITGYAFMVLTWKPESQKISESVIRETAAAQLHKNPNELTDEDFKAITRLSLSGKRLYDIKLLRKFTNLKELDLERIDVPEIDMPKWIALLVKAGIIKPSKKTLIIDLKPTKSLDKLQRLNLMGTNVKNIKPLKNLTNLQSLNLRETNVSDIRPLAGLKNLQYLNIFSTPVMDINPLSNLINLRELCIKETQVVS